MARIVCFSDTPALSYAVRQGLANSAHDIHLLSASRLSNEVRETVRALKPDVILMELTSALDNAHLFFFLRADNMTHNVPIVLLSTSIHLGQQAAILGANSFLRMPCDDAQIVAAVQTQLKARSAFAAA